MGPPVMITMACPWWAVGPPSAVLMVQPSSRWFGAERDYATDPVQSREVPVRFDGHDPAPFRKRRANCNRNTPWSLPLV